jgi:diketogulonate reductase-like aldo/keto reductase
LAKLQLDYIDLYLVHWMFPSLSNEEGTNKLIVSRTPLHKVWQDMENLVKKGLVRSIGVSNATTPVLLDILTFCEIKPVTNQIEVHPYLA